MGNILEQGANDGHLERRIDTILASLSPGEPDALYRRLWLGHVKEDVRARIQDTKASLTGEEIEQVARRYVYQGDYDCNQSYWDNIDALIRELPSQQQRGGVI